MSTSMTIAVDLAKTVFEVAVADSRGTIIERHRLSRAQFQRFFHNRDRATVVMEACGTAHFWARELTRLGFTVRLLPRAVCPPLSPAQQNGSRRCRRFARSRSLR